MITEDLDRSRRRADAALRYLRQPQAPQVGMTPKSVVWTKNKAKLYRYHGDRRHATPILFVYALINRPYILDLSPGNSLIEFLVTEGYDVYLLDWGTPGEEDADLSLDDYVLDYLPRAVKQVLRASGSQELSLFGYCIGGTLAALYAAAHREAPVRNLIMLTAPIDFTDAGLYTAWLDPSHFNVDRVVDTLKMVPAEMIDMGAKWLKPLQNYMGPYVTLAERLDDERFVTGWLAMNHWVNDGVPFPGEAYRQWIRDFYQGNKLIKGELTLGGRHIRLENIRCSVLTVYAELDHIVSPSQALALMDAIASTDAQVLPIRAGHVGVVAGSAGKKSFFPKLDTWLSERSS